MEPLAVVGSLDELPDGVPGIGERLTGALSGCRVLSWRLGYHLAARVPAVTAQEARRLTAHKRPAARQVPGDQDGPQGEAPVLASRSACQ